MANSTQPSIQYFMSQALTKELSDMELDSEYWLHPTPEQAIQRRASTVIYDPTDEQEGWITLHHQPQKFKWSKEKHKWIAVD